MFTPNDYLVIAPVQGLNLTTDLVIGEAMMFGCPPDYKPEPQVTQSFKGIYDTLAYIPFSDYPRLSRPDTPDAASIDTESMTTVRRLPHGWRMANYACVCCAVTLEQDHSATLDGPAGTGLLEWLLRLGDQVVDLLRLFLYTPGEDCIVGRAGALGRGISGLWLCSSYDGTARFLARRLSHYELVQKPVRLDLKTFRRWYSTDTFREFRTSACTHPDGHRHPYDKVFAAMRSFRESREATSLEGRLRSLMPLIEDSAQRRGERLEGRKLRERIAQVAWTSLRDEWDRDAPLHGGPWEDWKQLEGDVSRLWSMVRNPLAHSCRTLASMSPDPVRDLVIVETLASSMIRALGRACFESGATDLEVYDILGAGHPPEPDDGPGGTAAVPDPSEQPPTTEPVDVPGLIHGPADPEFPLFDGSPNGSDLPERVMIPNRSGGGGEKGRAVMAHADETAEELYQQTRSDARTEGLCVRCRSQGVSPADFRDDCSRKEFLISGMCQECQDKVFADPCAEYQDSEDDVEEQEKSDEKADRANEGM